MANEGTPPAERPVRALGSPLTIVMLGVPRRAALAVCSSSRGPDAAAAAPATSVAGTAVGRARRHRHPGRDRGGATTTGPTADRSRDRGADDHRRADHDHCAPTARHHAAAGPRNVEPIGPAEAPLAAVGSSSGGETARIQQRLVDLNFWTGAVDGSYGLTTKQAVMAFQKYAGLTPAAASTTPRLPR